LKKQKQGAAQRQSAIKDSKVKKVLKENAKAVVAVAQVAEVRRITSSNLLSCFLSFCYYNTYLDS
jgi:hypothetical protein